MTDHNRIEGALKAARRTDFLVIPGAEVNSRDGHIVALNIREMIPRNLSAEETVEQIHAAAGLAVACHPFALLKGSLGKHVHRRFDAVETINASAFPFNRSVRKAKEIAERFTLPTVAGTDAHFGPEIGYAYTLVDAEPSVDAVVSAIAKGHCKPFGKPIPLRLKLEKQYEYFKRKIVGPLG